MEAQEDSCKARGNRSGKSPEVVITRKRRPERRIGHQLSLYSQRNIEEHKIKLKYQTRQRQNQTKNRTRTGGMETKKQNRDRLTETEDLEQ